MKRLILTLFATTITTVLLSACGAPAGNNTATNNANKPANANATTAPAADTAAAEAEIKKVIDATQSALSKNDADAMDKIYADNYMTVNQDGSVQTRAERLAALRSGQVKYESFGFSDVNVRVNPEGNGAVTISKLTLKGTFKGKPMDGDFRVTGIYSKTRDGWKLAGSQTTRIEVGGSEPAKTDEKKPEANANK